MFLSIHQLLRKVADDISIRYGYGETSESPYINIPIFQTRLDPSDTKQVIQDGPPSMTNEPGRSQRGNPKNLMQFQGERPEVDSLINKSTVPVTNTVINEEKTNVQGEPVNDSVTPGGHNEDRDTIGFNPGEWTEPGMDAAPSGWNDPYDNR
jgi:hypothetical protein